MKKQLLYLFLMAIMIVMGSEMSVRAASYEDDYYIVYNSKDETNADGFFVHSSKHNFKSGSSCKYLGNSLNKGLKMESATTTSFTTTANASTVTIVRWLNADRTIKFDGVELTNENSIIRDYEVNADADNSDIRVFVVDNVAAGEHTISRGGGETTLFYIGVSTKLSTTAPSISINDGLVTITTNELGATTYYTIDGSDPTTESSVYSAPFEVTFGTIVKAFSVNNGSNSDIVSATYVLSEASPSTVTKDEDIVGVSYTVSGSYIAGAGAKKGDMPNNGAKFRTGTSSNTLTFDVNPGWIITDIKIVGFANDEGTIDVTSAYVDGDKEKNVLPATVTLPASTEGKTKVVAVTGIQAKSAVTFAFDNSNVVKNTQWSCTFEVTYIKNESTQQYTITTAVSPADAGVVTPANGTEVAQGGNVTLTATPKLGYAFKNWTDSEGNEVSTDAAYTIENVSADINLTANFVESEIEWRDIKLTLMTQGLLTDDEYKNKTNVEFGIVVAEDGSISRVAANEPCHAVISGKYNNDHGWVNVKLVVPVKGNVKIGVGSCNYAGHTITVKNSKSETVTSFTVPKLGDCYKNKKNDAYTTFGYYIGEAETLTIECPSYTPYISVLSSLVEIGESENTILPKHVYEVTGCVTKGDNQLIDSSHDGDYIKFDVVPTVTGVYSFTSMIGTKNDGMGVTLGYIDAEGNYVASEKKSITNSGNWNVGEDYTWDFALEAGQAYTFKMLCHAAGSYCVNVFEMGVVKTGEVSTKFTVTTAASPAAAGTVSPESGTEVYEGSSVTFRAEAKTGYKFVNWTDGEGNVVSTEAEFTMNEVSADINMTANFEVLPKVVYDISGDAEIEGVAPSLVYLEAGSSITIPANYTLYKEGYTLTGWTDGNTTYNIGAKVTITEDVTLTPVFRANTVSLANRSEALTITWDFQRKNGAPEVAWQYKTAIFVTKATICGETIDVKMDIDATSGKVANGNWTDWVQLNGGTILTIPACQGAVVSLESYSATTTTTIAGDVINQGTKTPTYTYEGDAEAIDIVIGDGSYFRWFSVTLPVEDIVLSINESGYSTFYANHAVKVPTGLTAYVGALSANADYLSLVELTEGYIPAQTGVVLAGEPGSYDMRAYTKETEAVESDLSGVAVRTAASNFSGSIYALTTIDSETAFYQYTGSYIPANKAFLVLPAAAAAPKVRIATAETGIEGVTAEQHAADIYNLQGQKVEQVKAPGLYIVGGKKVLVK